MSKTLLQLKVVNATERNIPAPRLCDLCANGAVPTAMPSANRFTTAAQSLASPTAQTGGALRRLAMTAHCASGTPTAA